jgi:hypothetical protein
MTVIDYLIESSVELSVVKYRSAFLINRPFLKNSVLEASGTSFLCLSWPNAPWASGITTNSPGAHGFYWLKVGIKTE